MSSLLKRALSRIRTPRDPTELSKAKTYAIPVEYSRPEPSFYTVGTEEGAKIPVGYRWFQLYLRIYLESDVVRTVIDTVRREILRGGLRIEQEYAAKCTRCGKEFDVYTPTCDECGAPTERPPERGRRVLRDLVKGKPVNASGETIYDILDKLELDLEIFDNAYLLFIYRYEIDKQSNRITRRFLDEIRAIRPLYVAKIVDNSGRPGYDNEGRIHFVCPVHRDDTIAIDAREWDGRPPKCPKCGLPMMVAGYVIANYPFSAPTPPVRKTVYAVDEVVHVKKYFPNDIYGISPLYAAHIKALTLLYMDRMLYKYFARELPPRGLLVLPNLDPTQLERLKEEIKRESGRNPHWVPMIAVSIDRDSGTKKLAEYIDLHRDLKEIALIEARNEFRRQIGALYGVTGMFTGDTESGGWNNQGLQIIVSNRAIMWGQSVLETRVLDKIVRAYGVRGWKLRLIPPERREKMAELDYLSRLADVLAKFQKMGFNVELDREFNYKISKEPVSTPSHDGDVRTPEEREIDRSRERVRDVQDYLSQLEGAPQEYVSELTGTPHPKPQGEFKGIRPEEVE